MSGELINRTGEQKKAFAKRLLGIVNEYYERLGDRDSPAAADTVDGSLQLVAYALDRISKEGGQIPPVIITEVLRSTRDMKMAMKELGNKPGDQKILEFMKSLPTMCLMDDLVALTVPEQARGAQQGNATWQELTAGQAGGSARKP